MVILGFCCVIFMGVVLGLVGAGGSILLIPILIHLFGLGAITATGYSLFVVGGTSLIGLISYYRKGLLDFGLGFLFGLPALCSVYLVRRFALPALPDVLFEGSIVPIGKDQFILLAFSIVMLVAATSMIKNRVPSTNRGIIKKVQRRHVLMFLIAGSVVGGVTGFVGAGGGFLIVPALTLLGNSEMKTAIGTSLFVIALNCLVGFVGDLQNMNKIDWPFLLELSFCALTGMLLGSSLSSIFSNKKLKSSFGLLAIVIGFYTLIEALTM